MTLGRIMGMRGSDEKAGPLFSDVDLEEHVPAGHPLRLIRRVVNDALACLDTEFEGLYAPDGRPLTRMRSLDTYRQALRSCRPGARLQDVYPPVATA